MSDIGLAGGVGEEQISDSGLSDAQSFTDFSPSGSDGDSYAQASANILAEPIAGRNRSNITNLVDARTGQSLYDPTFAAALDISRGLDPTFNFGGTGGLAVPSYLRPQVPGNKVLNEAGDRMMYGSPVERFFQEDLTDAIRSTQKTIAGIPSLYSLGIDAIKSVLDGASFLNNSKAGKTVEQQADDQKRIEIADLEKIRLESLKTAPIDEVKKTELDKFDDRPSIAELAEQRKRQNALNAISDMFDNKGIVSLSQADKIINELKNQQIAAGTSKGTDLSFDPYSSAENFQKAKDLGILNEFGLTAAEQAKVDFSSRGFAEDPKDRPRDPNNPGGTMLTFPDPINDLSLKAPPGFVDIVMEEGKSPTFAGTDISIFGGRDPSAKLYSPLTEAEAQAQIDTGFSLEPIPYDFPLSLSPRDFTGSGVRAGVDLTPADFRVEQSDPEKVMRVPKSSLPASAQELASLRSGELDYGTSFPLQTILDARREVDSGNFTQKEMSDFLAGFR